MMRDRHILDVAAAIGLDYDIIQPFLEKQKRNLAGLIAQEVGELIRNMHHNAVAVENIAYALGLSTQLVDDIIKRR